MKNYALLKANYGYVICESYHFDFITNLLRLLVHQLLNLFKYKYIKYAE